MVSSCLRYIGTEYFIPKMAYQRVQSVNGSTSPHEDISHQVFSRKRLPLIMYTCYKLYIYIYMRTTYDNGQSCFPLRRKLVHWPRHSMFLREMPFWQLEQETGVEVANYLRQEKIQYLSSFGSISWKCQWCSIRKLSTEDTGLYWEVVCGDKLGNESGGIAHIKRLLVNCSQVITVMELSCQLHDFLPFQHIIILLPAIC